MELLVAIGDAYLNADKIPEAQEYAGSCQKSEWQIGSCFCIGRKYCRKTEKCGSCFSKSMRRQFISIRNVRKPYLKYADIYKSANASLAIEKPEPIEGLGTVQHRPVDKKLAEIYYLKNDFNKAVEAHANFAMGPTATEEDLVKYAFCFIFEP